MLRRVRPQLQGCDPDIPDDPAIHYDNVANDRGFGSKRQHAAAPLVDAVPDADMLHRRTVCVFHGMGSLGTLGRDAIVRDGEKAAVDGDVP